MSVRIVHAHDLGVFREPLLERRHRVRAHADGMHLVGAALSGFARELPRDDVQEFVGEDLVHRAESPGERRRLMEIDVARVRLDRAVEDEPKPRESALLLRQQEVGRFGFHPGLPPEVLLFEGVEPEQPAREPARQDPIDFSGRAPDQHRQALPGRARRREHDQRRRRAESGHRGTDQAQPARRVEPWRMRRSLRFAVRGG